MKKCETCKAGEGYRLLKEGDNIQEGDEFLGDSHWYPGLLAWEKINPNRTNMPFDTHYHRPMRRPLS